MMHCVLESINRSRFISGNPRHITDKTVKTGTRKNTKLWLHRQTGEELHYDRCAQSTCSEKQDALFSSTTVTTVRVTL